MFEPCSIKDGHICAFSGRDLEGRERCGLAGANNIVSEMNKCPIKKPSQRYTNDSLRLMVRKDNILKNKSEKKLKKIKKILDL
tara:strand:- start:1115 stop:1363 length:249 start_codon:yes stop_codon:yes gene_type:complete